MRSDFGRDENQYRGSEAYDATNTTIFGYNALKVARYLNLISGTALIALSILNLLNIFE